GGFMKNWYRWEEKLPVFLVSAILVSSIFFFIASCGNDPQQKTKNTDKGAFAIDFSMCPGDMCRIYNDRSPAPDVSKPLTVEAWVKSRGTEGGIFSRMDSASGVALYVKNDEPKFSIRVATGASTTTPGVTGSVDYIVGSGFTLVRNAWTHVAGVVANVIHQHPTSTECTSTVMAEKPHLDIYVDGAFQNCATTWDSTGANGDPATGPQFADNPGGSLLVVGDLLASVDGVSGTIDAVIDEVRVWTTARTEDDIQDCMDRELGTGGSCNRGDNNLKLYYRLNEGKEATATDFSGNGLSGSVFTFTPDEEEWEDGWVKGNTDLKRSD
ncbi:MAG: LamG domain-containing protein, partial [Nitrospiraceae bacterium]